MNRLSGAPWVPNMLPTTSCSCAPPVRTPRELVYLEPVGHLEELFHLLEREVPEREQVPAFHQRGHRLPPCRACYSITSCTTGRGSTGSEPIEKHPSSSYIAAASLIEIVLLLYKPNYTWPGLIIVLLGIPVYYFWRGGEQKT